MARLRNKILTKYGLLSQAVHTLTLVTTKLPYTYRTRQMVYEYHQINRSLFWGYKREGAVLIAEPEKALLDLIYIRCVSNRELNLDGAASLVNDMAVHELDLKRLHQYSKKFSPGTRRAISELKI